MANLIPPSEISTLTAERDAKDFLNYATNHYYQVGSIWKDQYGELITETKMYEKYQQLKAQP